MQTEKLDKRDRQILNLLQDNGRLSNAELAEKVNLSPSACLRRVRQLEETGLIAGYHMQLNLKACDLSGAAFVFVTLDGQGRGRVGPLREGQSARSTRFRTAICWLGNMTICCGSSIEMQRIWSGSTMTS